MKQVVLILKPEQVDYIGGILAKQPYLEVAEIISDISYQIKEQVAENEAAIQKTETPASDI